MFSALLASPSATSGLADSSTLAVSSVAGFDSVTAGVASSALFPSASSVVATFSTIFCSFLEEASLTLSFFTNSVFSSELGCVGSSEAFTAPPFANIKLRVVPKNTDATPTLYFLKEKRCCSFLIILISSPFIFFTISRKIIPYLDLEYNIFLYP